MFEWVSRCISENVHTLKAQGLQTCLSQQQHHIIVILAYINRPVTVLMGISFLSPKSYIVRMCICTHNLYVRGCVKFFLKPSGL